ncbi:MAG: PKD domain-containing protein [Candidatus Thermoplasmatota archaeon]|nr:PKD domain-containing protein [Candidatus Thermoplasmatota archaeon]MBU1941281.1 PKD domain-containing protein [Candidatus Thermoplasmatota archaeon]
MLYKQDFQRSLGIILTFFILISLVFLPTCSTATELHETAINTMKRSNIETPLSKKPISDCSENRIYLATEQYAIQINTTHLTDYVLHTTYLNLTDITSAPRRSKGLDWSWMDFKPGGGTIRDGGLFEDTEATQWAITKYVWQDGDPFDNTDEFIPEWCSNNQLYSFVRSDEDLLDGTSQQGAWCTAAGENAFWPGYEDSRGWAKCELAFNIADFVDTSPPGFCFINSDNPQYQTRVFCDYKIHAPDFDDTRNHVYFNIYLDDGTREWPFGYNAHTGESDMPKNDGWCTAFWDPEYTGGTNPSVFIDDYNTDFIVDYTQGNQMYGCPLGYFFNNYGLQFTFRFELYIRLYGEYFDDEYLKFWVDHAGIKLCYWYSDEPYEPHTPTPADGTHYVAPSSDLQWYGGDPDTYVLPIDTVTYKIYLGTSPNPPYVGSIGPYPADNQGPFSWTPPGGLAYDTHYYWKIVAQDSYGLNMSSEEWEFWTENNPPSTPSIPNGPITGWHGSPYQYSTSATDPDNHYIQYGWDWGDNSPIEWTGLYAPGTTCSASHSWSQPGSYQITVKARDELGGESDWSLPLSVQMNNRAPTPPGTPTGQLSGWHGESYTYFTSSSDPDGDQISYYYDWGDGTGNWTGLYASGATADYSHQWSIPGTFEVKTKAKDMFGAESGYCTPSLFVYMGNRAPQNPTDPFPAQYATWIDIETNLSWSCSDPDGDTLHYSIYFDTVNPPAVVQTNYSLTTYNPGTLLPNTTYYWQIEAFDNWGGSCIGSLWEFTTREYHCPILSPYNGWTAGVDKTWGTGREYFTFKVHYYDSDGDIPVIKQVIIDSYPFDLECCSPDPSDGDYFVRILGKDIGGGQHFYHFFFQDGTISESVRLPLSYDWDFTVNYPPEKPSVTGRHKICVNTRYNFSAVSFDFDGDTIYYWFDWGDGMNSGWVGPFASGDTAQAAHTWSKWGEYEVKVHARDHPHGDLSENGTLVITVPCRISQYTIPLRLYYWWIEHPLFQWLPVFHFHTFLVER